METRELFARLVLDEPPLTISASSVSARGHQAARRRLARVGAAGVAALVVATGGVVQLARPDQRHRGTLVPVGQPAISSLPFTSAAQITASKAKVYALLVAQAERLGPLPVQKQAFVSPAVRDVMTSAEAMVQLASRSPSVFVHLTVAAPDEARARYADALTKGPCAGAIPNGRSGVSCRRQALPGGGALWTYDAVQPHLPHGGTVTSSTPIELMQRSVLVVATDGSALQVMEFAELPGDGNDVALPVTGVLDGPALSALAQTAAIAWQAAG